MPVVWYSIYNYLYKWAYSVLRARTRIRRSSRAKRVEGK